MLWIVVFAISPAKVKIYPSETHHESFYVKAGVTKLSIPLRVGDGMKARIKRGGSVVAECFPQEFRFNGTPDVYNFNAFVAMSN